MLRLIAAIMKCPDFLPEMSGILNTRIPTYCNSDKHFLRGFVMSSLYDTNNGGSQSKQAQRKSNNVIESLTKSKKFIKLMI